MMYARPVFIASLLLLTSCASMIDGDMQQVAFVTKGVTDAKCTVYVGAASYKYSVLPPQKIWINKSSDDMTVECHAQGGREASVTIKSSVAAATFANVLNGTLGATYDAETGSMFKYPDEVVVDFTKLEPQYAALPSYENTDALHPNHASEIEYLGPRAITLPEDSDALIRGKMAAADAAKEEADAAAMTAERNARMDAVADQFNGDKGGKASAKKSVEIDPSIPVPVKHVAPVAAAKAAQDPVAPLPSYTVKTIPKAPAANEEIAPGNPQLSGPRFPSTTSF